MSEMFDLLGVPGAVVYRNGMPHVDWWAVFDHIRVTVPPDECPHRVTDAVDAWLDLLAAHLGNYTVSYGDGFCVLHPAADSAEEIFAVGEAAREFLLNNLNLPENSFLEESEILILAFARVEERLSYIDNYYPADEDGKPEELPLPEGMLIPDLITHIVTSPRTAEQALPYLLTQAATRDLPLPDWLNAGLPHAIECLFHDIDPREFDDVAMREAQRDYWAEHTLQPFWTGEAFTRTDGGSDLAHLLSTVIVSAMLAEHGRDAFLAFLRDVEEQDAGEAAAQTHLSTSLDQLASPFIT